MKKVGLIFAALSAFAVGAHAGWEWERLGRFTPDAMFYPAMTYDSVNDRVLLLSGFSVVPTNLNENTGKLFVRESGEWSEVEGKRAPGRPVFVGAAFDEKRGVLVLYGGQDSIYPSDRFSNTLEWDGKEWLQPKHSYDPGNISMRPAMTYDTVSESVLLYHRDTLYSYNGKEWRALATGPDTTEAWLVHDRIRGVSVLVAEQGKDYSTWEWDGDTLVYVDVETPAIVFKSPAVYDEAAKCVRIFAMPEGDNPTSRVHYEYRSRSWTRVSEELKGPFVSGMVFDRSLGVTLSFGGSKDSLATDIEQHWINGRWQDVDNEPASRYFGAMEYDPLRRQLVLFGGRSYHSIMNSDTWIYENGRWIRVPTFSSPPSGHGYFHAFDIKRGRMVIVGGLNFSTFFDETWEWDGSSWHKGTRPPVANHSICSIHYDPQLESVVLHTWNLGVFAYDGDSWRVIGRGNGHWDAIVVFDEARRVPVAVHGAGAISEHGPTGWRLVYSPQWSQPTVVTSAVYLNGKVVIVAGRDRRNEYLPMLPELYTWDGSSLQSYRISGAPSFRLGASAVVDSHRNRMIMYGGLGLEVSGQQSYSDNTARTETWSLMLNK